MLANGGGGNLVQRTGPRVMVLVLRTGGKWTPDRAVPRGVYSKSLLSNEFFVLAARVCSLGYVYSCKRFSLCDEPLSFE